METDSSELSPRCVHTRWKVDVDCEGSEKLAKRLAGFYVEGDVTLPADEELKTFACFGVKGCRSEVQVLRTRCSASKGSVHILLPFDPDPIATVNAGEVVSGCGPLHLQVSLCKHKFELHQHMPLEWQGPAIKLHLQQEKGRQPCMIATLYPYDTIMDSTMMPSSFWHLALMATLSLLVYSFTRSAAKTAATEEDSKPAK